MHHSDSYAANLVPFMIEMGIDIWQGLFPQQYSELIENTAADYYGGTTTERLTCPTGRRN